MTDATPPTGMINLASIDAVLARLGNLKAQVHAARETLKPLEDGLEQAKREYQDHTGPLLRQINKLRAEVAELDDQIRALEGKEEPIEKVNSDPIIDPNGGNTGKTTSTEAKEEKAPVDLEKDELLELARRLLDPDVNPEDANLIGEIDGMVSNPAVTLADILERLPWGVVWEQAAVTEDLPARYRRLSAWERALANQLTSLKRGEERLRRDSRYPLWQWRQQGLAAWQTYLADAERQLQNEIRSQEQRRADRQTRLRVLIQKK